MSCALLTFLHIVYASAPYQLSTRRRKHCVYTSTSPNYSTLRERLHIAHILFWSNIKSGFLIFTWKTKSRGCFPQSCLNIVLVWDLGEMFKNVWLFGGPAVQRSWDPRQAWTRITWQIWFFKKVVKLDNHIFGRLTWIPRPAILSFWMKGVWKGSLDSWEDKWECRLHCCSQTQIIQKLQVSLKVEDCFSWTERRSKHQMF